MNRRGFLKALGLTAAAAVIAPEEAPAAIERFYSIPQTVAIRNLAKPSDAMYAFGKQMGAEVGRGFYDRHAPVQRVEFDPVSPDADWGTVTHFGLNIPGYEIVPLPQYIPVGLISGAVPNAGEVIYLDRQSGQWTRQDGSPLPTVWSGSTEGMVELSKIILHQTPKIEVR